MKKIIIIGCPGSGKSTFARELNKITGIPIFYLDMLNWNSDRTTVPKDVFIGRLKRVIEYSTWIIDGNYGSTLEMRISACDTVFFLDYPTEVCLSGIESRKGKARPDMPWIEDKDTPDDEEFIHFIKSYNTDSRPKVLSLLEKYSHKNITVFHNRKESDNYLETLKNT